MKNLFKSKKNSIFALNKLTLFKTFIDKLYTKIYDKLYYLVYQSEIETKKLRTGLIEAEVESTRIRMLFLMNYKSKLQINRPLTELPYSEYLDLVLREINRVEEYIEMNK